ncbi:terminase family protein [bacterium]|nr:terminase family protein [bacterium]
MANVQERGYNGNVNLKRKGTPIEFTQDMVGEFIKCANNPTYFSEKYIQIVHVDRGLIPIKMYDYQKEIVEKITNNRRVAVVTSRQAGKTTTAVAVILHYVLFNEHKTCALLANKGDAAREILDRIKIAYEALPKWLQQGVIEWNKGSVEFENGCKIIAGSTSSSAIRGKSISFLYIDETAFVENWDEFFASVFPTISSGKTTKMLYTSTPNGLNHFYKTCEGAKADTNGFEYVEVPWQRVPGRDEAWRKETLAAMDQDTQKFSQEFECGFLGSSGTLIEGGKLKNLVPRTPVGQSQHMKVYEKPQKDHTYVCVVDVARGKGLDYSAFQIIDVTEMPYRQVCVFKDNMITPIDYAEIIYRSIKSYNEAYTLVEVNDIGEQVSETLHYEFEVETLMFTESAGRSGKRISTGFSKKADKGIRTTKAVKSVGCNMLKMLVEQDQLILNDFDTINELSTFSRKGNSYEAESGCHDDLTMCLVLFGWMTDQLFFKEITNINTVNNLRQRNEEELAESLLPIGFNDYDMTGEEKIVSVQDNDNSWLL